MYLSTSTQDFSEMYLSTFQVLYKLYLSTDVLKYKVLLPGSVLHNEEFSLFYLIQAAVQAHSHLTYNVLRYTPVWWMLTA